MVKASAVVKTYPLSNYTWGPKESKMEKYFYVSHRLSCLKLNYMKEGMRRSVEAILVVQEHNHPHILLLKIGNTFYKLPGGRLKPGENEIEGLKGNCLANFAANLPVPQLDWQVQEHNHPYLLLFQIGNTLIFKLPGGRLKPGQNEIEGLKRKLSSKLATPLPALQPNWQIGECVAMWWWRPNFEPFMYPYCLPHITKPKECRKLFIVHLSAGHCFAVPKNMKFLAVRGLRQ